MQVIQYKDHIAYQFENSEDLLNELNKKMIKYFYIVQG